MRRKRSKQLEMRFAAATLRRLPDENERELVDALADLLLAAAMDDEGDEGLGDDDREDLR